MSKKKKDSDIFEYSILKGDDGKEWFMGVFCESGISEQEFGKALISLGEDVLAGRVTYQDLKDKGSLFVSDDTH